MKSYILALTFAIVVGVVCALGCLGTVAVVVFA